MKSLLIAAVLLFATAANAASFSMDGPCNVYFSPNGGAEDAVISLINRATRSVHMLAYSFTSPKIAASLVAAKQRGVDVNVILDKSQPTANSSQMKTVMAGGVPVWIDSKHPIAHNKVILVDGNMIETGSYNFTYSGNVSNGENSLICPSIAGYNIYFKNWQLHQSHSVRQ
jgi:phosphatidylserine/phosphatidylglycerophosphate/cardiolipin synthase-like enzyme